MAGGTNHIVLGPKIIILQRPTCCPTMLGATSVRKFCNVNIQTSERRNIVRFFVVYSKCQSVLITHVRDAIVQDTNSVNPKH